MSFRDVAFGKKSGAAFPPRGNGRAVKQPRHRSKPIGTNRYHPSKTNTGPSASPLLYSQLRLVPSSSCESSIQTNSTLHQSAASLDEQSMISSSSSRGGFDASLATSSQDSLSLNTNSPPRRPLQKRTSNPQSGSVCGPTRGTPGFSVSSNNRRRGRNGIMTAKEQAAKIRGWSQGIIGGGQRGEHIHDTGTSPSARTSAQRKPNPQQATTDMTTTKTTKLTELATEIKHFQKMVAQLERLISTNDSSPEKQWRSRIMKQSCIDADRDIADKLYTLASQVEGHDGRTTTRVAASSFMKKLHRDYRRAHNNLDATLLDEQRKQQADVTSFFGGGANIDAIDPAMLLHQEQEDFFERATREREEELKKINHKMGKINDIYQDLAALVEGQQEQIDAFEDNVHAAKNSVDKGLKHIEYARDRLCVMGDDGYEVPQCGNTEDAIESRPKSAARRNDILGGAKPTSRGGGDWSFQSLQKDLFGIGNDLASLGCTFTDSIECGMGKKSVFEEGDGNSISG